MRMLRRRMTKVSHQAEDKENELLTTTTIRNDVEGWCLNPLAATVLYEVKKCQ